MPYAVDHHFRLPRPTSLKNMRALQTCEAPYFVRLGWYPNKAPKLSEVLPPNLTALRVREGGHRFVAIEGYWRPLASSLPPILSEFVAGGNWRRVAPRLRHVSWPFMEKN